MPKRAVLDVGRNKDDLQRRLRKIEGQVQGLQRMVEEDRYCLDIVQQVNALSAATRKVALLVLEDQLRHCATMMRQGDEESALKEMAAVLEKALHP